MPDHWIREARRHLIDLRGQSPAWGYRPGSPAAVEPTALACLGLLATAEPDQAPADAAVGDGAAWMATIQGRDGSVGVAARLAEPGWSTPHAILGWSALGGFPSERSRAIAWLGAQRGTTIEPTPESPVGHDTTLVGWPWVAGTHSWVEPTAMAILALRAEGGRLAARIGAGARLLIDRMIPEGGWNYGNKAIFGRSLRPQPATTGLALLALAGLDVAEPRVALSCRYLERTLGGTRSTATLCWGLLGLEAWGQRPREADRWLEEASAGLSTAQQTAPRLAQLLLAAGGGSLRPFATGRREVVHV